MTKISFWNQHLIPLTISLCFFISLICYVGYLYGLGLNPTDIPLSITDIANSILTFSPSIIVFLIALYFFQFNQVTTNSDSPKEINIQETKSDQIPARITGIILFILLTWCAFWGTSWWMPFIILNTFILMIKLLDPPEIFPIFWTSIIKFILTSSAIIFTIGFYLGFIDFYSSKYPHMITLVDNKEYKVKILSNLSSGPLIKIKGKLLFLNMDQIKSITYAPSKSATENISQIQETTS